MNAEEAWEEDERGGEVTLDDICANGPGGGMAGGSKERDSLHDVLV